MQLDALDVAEEVHMLVLAHPLGGITDAQFEDRAAFGLQLVEDWIGRL